MSAGVLCAIRLHHRLLRIAFGYGFAMLPGLASCHRADPGSAEQNAAQTFTSVCAKCHGVDGRGGLPAMEGANPPRNFRDSAFQASRSDEQLEQVIRSGKGGMPAFGNLFPDADLHALVRKIRSFDPAKRQ